MKEILELLRDLAKLIVLCIVLIIWSMREFIESFLNRSLMTIINLENRLFKWIES